MATMSASNAHEDIYNRWESGDLETQAALELLAHEINGLREEFEQAMKAVQFKDEIEKQIKAHAEAIARESGEKTTVAGGFEFTIVERNPVTTFKSAQVETAITDMAALAAKMRENGLEVAADELANIMGNLASSKTTKGGSSYLRVAKQSEPVKAKK